MGLHGARDTQHDELTVGPSAGGRQSTPPRTPTRRREARPRQDWRLGGRSVHSWNGDVLVAAAVCFGLGTLCSTLIRQLPVGQAGLLSLGAWWALLMGAVAYALLRSIPGRLLSFQLTDVLWGIGIATVLRGIEGFMPTAHSTYPTLGGIAQGTSWEVFFLISIVGGPLVEELFFRGVLLVSVYRLLRRPIGSVGAGATSAVVSSAAFVISHASAQPLGLVEITQLVLLGISTAMVVLATGRLAGAIILHAVYNAAFVGAAVLGTLLA